MSIKDRQFESLVKSFYQPLYRYAFWICKSQSLAEDLVQEVFARAWKNLHQLKEFSSAKPWLFTILNRENARRFERKPLPLVDMSEDWQLESVADDQDAIQTMLLRREIFRLELIYREPLILQIIGGLSLDEIASVLALNSNTVSTRLFRARNELKQKMTAADTPRGKHHG